MRFKVIFVAIFFLFTSFSFSYQEVKNLNLSAEGIKKLEIDCGAGFLKINGIESLREIEVTAEIEGKDKEFIRKYVDLSLEKRGSKAVLISKYKQHFSLFSFKQRLINLTVRIPKNMDLDIDDGSGSINIENIKGMVDIDDGSGDLYIKNIEGILDIDDGSGEIKAKDISGDLSIDDGSGDIRVENIKGDIDIEDSSGGIEAKDIYGDISIDDGSGSIYISHVQGGVIVSDGSGSINIDGIEKNVVIKEDGSGSVNIKNVKGKIIK